MSAEHFSFVSYTDLRDLVDTAAERYPNTEFFISSDKLLPHISGRQLRHCCAAFAFFARREGNAGEHIAILGRNCAAWITAFFAVVTGGCVAAPLSVDAKTAELDYCVKKADCTTLIYDFACEKDALELKRLNPELRLVEMHELVQKLLGCEGEYRPRPEPGDIAALYFTSGTTANSRCVILTHGNLTAHLNAAMAALPLSPDDIGLSVLPPSHTFELMTNIVGALHCGGTLYINESIRTVKRNLKKYQPSILVVVPLVLQMLHKQIIAQAKKNGKLEQLEKGLKLSAFLQRFGIDISHKLFAEVYDVLGGKLRYFLCGGAPLDKRIVEFFAALGITVLQGYGITECSPIVAANLPEANRMGSVGKQFPCCEVKVIDGEICVRGGSVSPGYYRDDIATHQAFYDGWFHTGDLGYTDKNGYIFFTGRRKNLIVLPNGENVSPEELEEKLYRIDGVEDALVSQDGGVICAEVYADRELIPDAASLQRIVDELNKELPMFKQIGRVSLRDEPFKKTSTQKIYRRGA